MEQNIDIKENYIYQLDSNLLAILLLDKSSGKNIIWATDNYSDRGLGYQSGDEIMIDSITHRNGSVIKPRTTKSKKEQAIRVRDKAEVFTPSWVCNSQNNLVDSVRTLAMVRVKGLDSRGGRNPRLVAGGRNCPPDSFSVPPLFKSSRLQDQKKQDTRLGILLFWCG